MVLAMQTDMAAANDNISNLSSVPGRRVPDGARRMVADGGLEVFVRTTAASFLIVGFDGKAIKPLLVTCVRSPAEATAAIVGFASGRRAARVAKLERKAAAESRLDEISVGDILVKSWGYDQTNVDFYVVTRKTAKRVFARQCNTAVEVSGKLGMSGQATPEPEKLVGFEQSFTARTVPSKWSGKLMHCSWYA